MIISAWKVLEKLKVILNIKSDISYSVSNTVPVSVFDNIKSPEVRKVQMKDQYQILFQVFDSIPRSHHFQNGPLLRSDHFWITQNGPNSKEAIFHIPI